MGLLQDRKKFGIMRALFWGLGVFAKRDFQPLVRFSSSQSSPVSALRLRANAVAPAPPAGRAEPLVPPSIMNAKAAAAAAALLLVSGAATVAAVFSRRAASLLVSGQSGQSGFAHARAPAPRGTLRMCLRSAIIFGAANTLGFCISVATNWHYHLDLIGTGVFAVVAVALRGSGEPRQMLSSVGVGIWATKLAGFLFYRALQTTRDTRLEETLSTTAGAFGFWLISFLWGFVRATTL